MASFYRCDVCLKEIDYKERRLWMVGEPQESPLPYTFYFDLCNECFQDVKGHFQTFIESIKLRQKTGKHDGSALYRSNDTWPS